MIKKIKIIIIAFSSLLLTGCATTTTEGSKLEVKVQVWAMKYLVQEIGKENVNVSLAVTSGDAHHKEPTQKEIAELSKSALFFYMKAGDLGREAEEIIKVAGEDKGKNIDLMSGVDPLANGTEVDPHAWLSPKQMIVMAETVKNQLVTKRTEKKNEFENNYAQVIEKLKRTDQELANTFTNTTTKEILVEHSAYGYMARDYGFEQHGLTSVHSHQEGESHSHEENSSTSEHTELSSSQIEALKEVVVEEKMTVLFSDSQNQSEMTEKVAKELGLTVEKVSTLETLSEAEEKTDYISHIKAIANKFAKAMG